MKWSSLCSAAVISLSRPSSLLLVHGYRDDFGLENDAGFYEDEDVLKSFTADDLNALLKNQLDVASYEKASMLAKQIEAMAKEEAFGCAWGLKVLGPELKYTDIENIAFPELNANYWITVMPVKDLSSKRILITGQVPEARYWSFQTYTTKDFFSSTIGDLRDENIVTSGPMGNDYTIRVNDGSASGDPTVNVLQGLDDKRNEGLIILVYRTYISVPFDNPSGGVDLPKISVGRENEELKDMQYCFNDERPTLEIQDPAEFATVLQLLGKPNDDLVTWARTTPIFTPLVNADIAYLAYGPYIQYKGYALVVRGRAPTFQSGSVMDPQVRFWSFCKLDITTKTIACVRDDEFELDANGFYTVVVSPGPAAPSGNGFNYLNVGPGPIGTLALRHMLPSVDFFPMSTFNVEEGDDEETVRTKMGDFYPETVHCKISTIEDEGVDACFA